MTTSDWKKAFKQLKFKPLILKKYKKHNAKKKRNTGITLRKCERCGRYEGHISQHGINLCRCCFREIATKIGFKKYS